MIVLGKRPGFKLIREQDVEDIRSAAQDPYSVGQVLVARPSLSALQLLLDAYDFEIESIYDWKSRLAGQPPRDGLRGYASGKRVTLRCRSREAAIAAGWEPVTPAPGHPRPTPARAAQSDPPPAAAQDANGWRGRVNKALARATGYELRRASTKS